MQLDRIEFTKNMICNISLEELLKGYFDETMAIYDLVESYYDCKISSNFDTVSCKVTLGFNTTKDSKSAYNILNSHDIISKYGRVFNYKPTHINKEVIIIIEEVVK